MRAAARQMRALLDEVAAVDWRHPAWWLVAGGTAVLEALPLRSTASDYVTSNGEPRADTFMARPAPCPDLASTISLAVVRARAASDALMALNGRYPEQPLLRQLDTRGSIVRQPPADPRTIVFAIPSGVFVAQLPADQSHDGLLAQELAAAYTGGRARLDRLRPVAVGAHAPLDACIGVSLYAEERATARHLHRRGWNAAGGPWLGLGHTDDEELVTTSHTLVDGFGHAELTHYIFTEVDRRREEASRTADWIRRRTGRRPLAPGPVLSSAQPLGVATRVVERVRFAELAYAAARCLDVVFGEPATDPTGHAAPSVHTFTPTMQIPIAPGARDDSTRFRRRVVPGLMALRKTAGQVEPFEAFTSRLPGLIAREAELAGVLTRVRRAAARLPVPRRFVRDWLARGAVPHPWWPPVEVLAGRGCLSYLRLPQSFPWPIFAVSAPALFPGPTDPRGGTVITAVDTAPGLVVTVSGTGLAGTMRGAEGFADQFLAELDAVTASRAVAARHDPR